jgi:hypothetical protein
MAGRVTIFSFAALALVAFIVYFAVALHFLPLTSDHIGVASLTLDSGLLSSLVGTISAVITARHRQASRAQISVCVVIGVFLVLISAFALYATRGI